MRAVPDSLDPAIVAGIEAQLREIEAREGVRVLWAIESGSRAWGFPSPDSDYDCRFLYVRPREEYLGPWIPRDVIEVPPDPVYDVNGWDLVKALRLLVKGNATVGEWLRSPIVYAGDELVQGELLALADEVSDPVRLRAHHLHVGRLQWPPDAAPRSLKRFMYALRSAATLRWLREHDAGVPPMDLPTLIAESDVVDTLREQVAEAIALKSRTREAEPGALPQALAAFVLEEFALAETADAATGPRRDDRAARDAATAFFRRALA